MPGCRRPDSGKGANSHSGVLAPSLEKTAEALRPIVVVLLALAILLLGVASLPRTAVPDPRLHDLLARHRVDLASVGAAALVAVAFLSCCKGKSEPISPDRRIRRNLLPGGSNA